MFACECGHQIIDDDRDYAANVADHKRWCDGAGLLGDARRIPCPPWCENILDCSRDEECYSAQRRVPATHYPREHEGDGQWSDEYVGVYAIAPRKTPRDGVRVHLGRGEELGIYLTLTEARQLGAHLTELADEIRGPGVEAVNVEPVFLGRPEHLPWCAPMECIVVSDAALHYGAPRPLGIDASDCGWRGEPSGWPEVTVRPIELGDQVSGRGRVGVELNAGDSRTRGSTSGSVGVSWLTPEEARDLAAMLVQAAADAEAVAQ